MISIIILSCFNVRKSCYERVLNDKYVGELDSRRLICSSNDVDIPFPFYCTRLWIEVHKSSAFFSLVRYEAIYKLRDLRVCVLYYRLTHDSKVKRMTLLIFQAIAFKNGVSKIGDDLLHF